MIVTGGLAWTGSAEDGSVMVATVAGSSVAYSALAPLADDLRRRGDPAGGFVLAASGLGIALHAIQRTRSGLGVLDAIAEAVGILHDLPVRPVAEAFTACIRKHRDLLGERECAARLILEARRLQRRQIAALTVAASTGRSLVPRSGGLLLAWPSGPAADLGEGLLTGVVAASGRRAEVLIAGPPELAQDAIRHLVGHGLQARTVAPEAVHTLPLAAVLVRISDPAGLAEPAVVDLAATALGRRIPCLGLGVDLGLPRGLTGLPSLPAACRRHLFSPPAE